MKIASRVALVTGGTRGLGLALVLRLAKDGWTVYTVARRRRGIDGLLRIAGKQASSIKAIQADLTNRGAIRRICRTLVRDRVTPHLVIHNAGLLGPRLPLTEWSRLQFDQVLAANLTAPFDLTRRLVGRMPRDGKVIFVSSGVTTGIRTNWGGYQVSKVALENLAGIFAAELVDSGPAIGVIDPGVIRTEMRAAAYPEEDPSSLPEPAVVAEEMMELIDRVDATNSGHHWRI